MAEYRLLISFRSNERPWNGSHDPYPKDRFGDDDVAAIKWARHFEAELPDYTVTLLKNGQPLSIGRDETKEG